MMSYLFSIGGHRVNRVLLDDGGLSDNDDTMSVWGICSNN